jgi:hypothetical protein
MITKKDIFKNEETVSVKAIFTKTALKQLTLFYNAGIENKVHNLTREEFIGWMAALGTMQQINASAGTDILKTFLVSTVEKDDDSEHGTFIL